MNFSPRSESDKIYCLVSYYKIYSDQGNWSQVLNYRLSPLVPASKDCIIGIYKAIISIHKSRLKKLPRNPFPTIEDLSQMQYGLRKQILKKNTISKYLKYMVEGMMQIIILDSLKENPHLGMLAYLNGLSKNNPHFQLQELRRSHKQLNNNLYSYSLLRDMYFHPLYDKRTVQANHLLQTTIEQYKKSTYLETFKLGLQAYELSIVKGISVPSFSFISHIIEDAQSNEFWNDPVLELYASFTGFIMKSENKVSRIISFAKQFPVIIKQTNENGKQIIPHYDAAYIYNLLTN